MKSRIVIEGNTVYEIDEECDEIKEDRTMDTDHARKDQSSKC